jgi:hypothetical protein
MMEYWKNGCLIGIYLFLEIKTDIIKILNPIFQHSIIFDIPINGINATNY